MTTGERASLPIWVLLVALIVWATGMPGDAVGAAPAQAGPELSVAPGTDLADGQQVTVTGHGFAAGQTVTIYQCATVDFQGLVDCDQGTRHLVRAGADGSVSTRLPVYAVVDTWGTDDPFGGGLTEGIDCREPGACMLATEISFQEVGAAVTAPLSFDPAAVEHLPTIAVSPEDGLVDRQEVRVEGQGFMRGERPLVRISQCGIELSTGEWCRANPTLTAELDEDGTFAVNLPVAAIFESWGQPIDCRTAAAACYLEAVVAGRNYSARTAVRAQLGFDPDAAIPDWPLPQVTVSPTTDLDDVHPLAVSGQGFTPGGTVEISQCRAEGPSQCENFTWPAADVRGVLDTEATVGSSFEAYVEPPLPSLVNCREAPGCVLIVRDVERDVELRTPLSFGEPEPASRYLGPVFDEVDVVRDVVYRETVDAHGNPVQLELDIYLPRGDAATRRPATVWMYGGYFIGGDKSSEQHRATLSARYGQVGIAINYRVRPDADSWRDMYLASLDAYDDATAAVEWLQQHADEYGIDPEAIFAGGFSAGAVTALNLAYLPGQRGPEQSLVAAAIPNAGLLYSPPEPGEPPTIAFHGTDDSVLPYDNIATLCPQAAEVDVACELVTYDGVGHGVGRPDELLWRSSAFVAEHVLGPLGYFDATADAAGPYEVEEGSEVSLDATSSAGDGLGYSWTPTDQLDDPSAPAPAYTGRDDGTETLSLTVTNDHGIAATDQAEVTTVNAAPTIDAVHTTRHPGRTVTLGATATDPGLDDTHQAEIDWGDGTVERATVEQDQGRVTIDGTHHYRRPGRYTVTLTVTDDDGGTDTVDHRVHC